VATGPLFLERDSQRGWDTSRQDVLNRTPGSRSSADEIGVDRDGCRQGDRRQPDQRARQNERADGKSPENPRGTYGRAQRGTSTEDRAVRTASGSENLSSSASGLSTSR
jgi:hypothetical protein